MKTRCGCRGSCDTKDGTQMATVVKSMATSGVDGFMVEIEVSTIRGQQQYLSIIGLPDQAIKGDLKINDFERSAGIIGARRCTHEGKEQAIRLAEGSASSGAAVISGMAKGIDSYAHTAAVKAGGYTIAILGNGPDLCYPEEHIKLYESICRTGCVLSESPPGVEPRRYLFPRRNRLIAAMSDELFIIDAGRNRAAPKARLLRRRDTVRNRK